MRVNVHAHVHPLRSIFEPELLGILWRRLDVDGIPRKITKIIAEVLRESPVSSRDELSAIILKQFSLDDELKSLLKRINESLSDRNLQLVIEGDIGSIVSSRLSDVVRDILTKSSDNDYLNDVYERDGSDYYRFLMRGLSPSIADLTKETMAELDDDDVLVALMMDICSPGQTDDSLFKAQISETTAQILHYPGRLLPFVKFNPKRKNALSLVKDALTHKGCCGVKLYPGLGYYIHLESENPYATELRALYQFCNDNEVPLLLHCNLGGFIETPDFVKFCDPDHLDAIFKEFGKLKICFGHFGDEVNFIYARGATPGSYTEKILSLMRKYKSRVYADLSFHVSQLAHSGVETIYFQNLDEWLNDADYGGQILFGTDSFLVQQRMSETSYWRYYQDKLGPLFKKVASDNPASFLGLPYGNRKAKANIVRYVDFLLQNKDQITGFAASWLLKHVEKHGTLSNLGKSLSVYIRGWNADNPIHKGLYLFLRVKGYIRHEFTEAEKFPIKELVFLKGQADPNITETQATLFCSQLETFVIDGPYEPRLKQVQDSVTYQMETREYLLKRKGDLKAFAIHLQKHLALA